MTKCVALPARTEVLGLRKVNHGPSAIEPHSARASAGPVVFVSLAVRLVARTPIYAADPYRAPNALKRCTVLEIMQWRANPIEMVVMSGFGPNADWLRNIEATPGPEIVLGARRFIAAHRFLDTEEAMQVIAAYEQRHRLFAPVVRRVLSRLLGWQYDGSERSRRRAVRNCRSSHFARCSDARLHGQSGWHSAAWRCRRLCFFGAWQHPQHVSPGLELYAWTAPPPQAVPQPHPASPTAVFR